MADSCRVDAYLVGTCIEQPVHIFYSINATAYRERDIDLTRHAADHIREGLAALKRSCDVEEDEFIGSRVTVGLAELHRVSRLAEVDEVSTFDRLSVFDIETWHDTFG